MDEGNPSGLIARLREAVERGLREPDQIESLLHEAVIELHSAQARALTLQREIADALDRGSDETGELIRAFRAANLAAAAIQEPERRLREHYERLTVAGRR